MKVLLVNGSARAAGCTFTALQEVAAALEKNGIETEIIQVGAQPIAGCIGCGACVEVCEPGCHIIKDGFHIYDRSRCIGCGKCAEVCYSLALTAEGSYMTVDDVMDTVLRDAGVYKDTEEGREAFLKFLKTVDIVNK